MIAGAAAVLLFAQAATPAPNVPAAASAPTSPPAAASAPTSPPAAASAPVLAPVSIAVTAESLTVLPGARSAQFRGRVTATRGALVITCAEADAEYEASSRKIEKLTLRGAVDVREGDRRAQGEQAFYDAASDTVTLTGKPRVEIESGEVLAEEAVLKPGHKTAEFRGGVVVRAGELRATARRLVAHYREGGEVRRLEMDGDVKAERGKRTARGERAVYEVGDKRLTLTGAPVLKEGETEVRGEKVVFTGDRVSVERPVARIHVDEKPGAAP
jgi:lipopolysaccharide export system protein LptA